jgi:hypothetical protein
VDEESIPALRPLDLVPLSHEGRRLFLLRDPTGVAEEAIVMPPPSAELLAFFDGTHSVRDVQTAIARATGRIVLAEQIRDFVQKLDANGFLDSPAYEARRRAIAHAYATAPARPAHFAGPAYAAAPDELRRQLDALFATPAGPGRPATAVSAWPRAIAAPHIDPGRGAATYAHAYARLWSARPERILILGVLHGASRHPFVLTGKDYETPLGVLRTDVRRVHALARRLAWDPLEEEELHRAEHSIEFQVLMLQHALSAGGERALDPGPEVLPILCAFSTEAFGPTLEAAAARAQIDAFLHELRALLVEDPAPTLIVAGVDLTHLGPRFGDAREMSAAWAEEIARRDRETLTRLTEGDTDAFVHEVVRAGADRRLCGFGALYALRTLISPARGRTLHYDQARDVTGLVSFAAIAFEGDAAG